MKTEIINVKKIYKGAIDIRDYIVERLIKNDIHAHVILNTATEKGEMILSPEQLKKHIRESEPTASKYNNSNYKLRGYKWKAEDKNQIKLF